MQMAIGLTQPADNAAVSIGQSLDRGLQTLTGLQDRDFRQQQQTQEGEREERRTQVAEGTLSQNAKEFAAQNELARKEHERRMEELQANTEYQQGVLNLRRQEVAGGGAEGQVNQRWTRLRDAMLSDPTPELAAITDPEQRKNRAELLAFEQINKTGQTREQTIADIIASQRIMLPNPAEDPEAYQEEYQALVMQAHSFADAAGLESRSVVPQATTPATVTPLTVGQTLSGPSGPMGQITQATDLIVTVRLPDGRMASIPRGEFEKIIAGGASVQ
jgi:hypothetical protein